MQGARKSMPPDEDPGFHCHFTRILLPFIMHKRQKFGPSAEGFGFHCLCTW